VDDVCAYSSVVGESAATDWFRVLSQKPENPKLCAVSPTFPEHFDFAVRLLVSAAVYATDTVDVFIVLDDTKQKDAFIELLANAWGNYQTQTETRSKRFELADIHIIDLFSMLAALDEPYGEAAPLPLPEDLNRWFGPTHVCTIPGYLPRTFNTKRATTAHIVMLSSAWTRAREFKPHMHPQV